MVLIAVFLVDLVLLAWRISDGSSKLQVLSFIASTTPTPVPTSMPTPTITPTPSPTLTPTPLPTPSPTPTSVPQPKFSQEQIHGFIERFAAQYSVDPNVLRHIATCESDFNAEAINGSYVGLFQFGSASWKSNRVIMGEDTDPDLRFNAEESVQTAAFIVSKGIKNIWPNCYP
ncbi:hypothetical protein A2Z67_02920 [Candidatus Woesebacteria bacterium RBG_13_36_22]|uniref:Transglycosylase SLT domain-containing protein n=1 Tax=Candidatus Woesebacteria bacterium RBG_13_36_22 TaxID=1802478 RepID=A0A1F7X611_9BACT|nr:MAG: hypothetical protein A2Z67_02920 [Candidatus Woesebacteria bacterium RBG_13_36_22]